MAANLQIIISAKDQSQGAFGSVQSSINGLAGALGAPFRAAGILTDALGKIGLAAIGIKATASAAMGLANAIRGPIDAASDLSETLSKNIAVFGQSAKAIEAWGNTSAQALGLSKQEAIAAAGGFGVLFTNAGMAEDAAASMSKSIVGLAGDLASFNNLDPGEVLEKLRSGLVGEAEPLRALGVTLNADMVKAKALEMGLADLNGEVSEGAKIQARYALIMQMTKKAQGDFARTSTGLANAQRIIGASFKDLSAEIGTRFLPLVAPLVSGFAQSLPAAIDLFTGKLDELGRVVGPIVEGIGSVFDDILFEGNLFRKLRSFPDMVKEAFGKLGSINWGSILGNAGDMINGWLGDASKMGEALIAKLGEAWAGLQTAWPGIWAKAGNLWDAFVVNAQGAGTKLSDALGSVWSGLQTEWPNIWAKAGDLWSGFTVGTGNVLGSLGKALGDAFAGLQKEWPNIWAKAGNIWDGFTAALGSAFAPAVTNAVTGQVTSQGGIVTQMQAWLGSQFGKISWPEVWKQAGNLWQGFATWASEFGVSLQGWIGAAWAGLKEKWPEIWAGAGDIFEYLWGQVEPYAQRLVDWAKAVAQSAKDTLKEGEIKAADAIDETEWTGAGRSAGQFFGKGFQAWMQVGLVTLGLDALLVSSIFGGGAGGEGRLAGAGLGAAGEFIEGFVQGWREEWGKVDIGIMPVLSSIRRSFQGGPRELWNAMVGDWSEVTGLLQEQLAGALGDVSVSIGPFHLSGESGFTVDPITWPTMPDPSDVFSAALGLVSITAGPFKLSATEGFSVGGLTWDAIPSPIELFTAALSGIRVDVGPFHLGPEGFHIDSPTWGSVPTPPTVIPYNSDNDVGTRIGRRAFGGPISPFMPYLVGERGPELFTSKIAGSILPAAQTKDLMSRLGNWASDALRAVGGGSAYVPPVYGPSGREPTGYVPPPYGPSGREPSGYVPAGSSAGAERAAAGVEETNRLLALLVGIARQIAAQPDQTIINISRDDLLARLRGAGVSV